MKALNPQKNPLCNYEEAVKKIEFKMPAEGEPVVLVRNEAPFLPCYQCGDKVAQFCQVRRGVESSWASWEDPELRLAQTVSFCSMPCGLA